MVSVECGGGGGGGEGEGETTVDIIEGNSGRGCITTMTDVS